MSRVFAYGAPLIGVGVLVAILLIERPRAPTVEINVPHEPIPGDPLAALDAEQRLYFTRWLSEHDQYDLIRVYYCDFERNRSSCEIRLSEGNPYLIVGDFNGDGQRDFAAFVQMKRTKPLRAFLAVFNGPVAGKPLHDVALLVEDQDFMRLGDELHTSTGSDGRTAVFVGPGATQSQAL